MTIEKDNTTLGAKHRNSLADEDILNFCWELSETDHDSPLPNRFRNSSLSTTDSVLKGLTAPPSMKRGLAEATSASRIFNSDNLKAIDSMILKACWKITDGASMQSLRSPSIGKLSLGSSKRDTRSSLSSSNTEKALPFAPTNTKTSDFAVNASAGKLMDDMSLRANRAQTNSSGQTVTQRSISSAAIHRDTGDRLQVSDTAHHTLPF
jgi:hypothetical protein